MPCPLASISTSSTTVAPKASYIKTISLSPCSLYPLVRKPVPTVSEGHTASVEDNAAMGKTGLVKRTTLPRGREEPSPRLFHIGVAIKNSPLQIWKRHPLSRSYVKCTLASLPTETAWVTRP